MLSLREISVVSFGCLSIGEFNWAHIRRWQPLKLDQVQCG
jgi:hypothetical protein